MPVFPLYSEWPFHVTKQHSTLNSTMNLWTLKTVIVEIISVSLKCSYSIGRAMPFLEKSSLNHSGKEELEVEPASIQWPSRNTFEHNFSENSLSSAKTSCAQHSYKAFIVILLNPHSTAWDWMRQGILLPPSPRKEMRMRGGKGLFYSEWLLMQAGLAWGSPRCPVLVCASHTVVLLRNRPTAYL